MAKGSLSITGWICNACACVGIQDLGSEVGPKEALHKYCKLQLIREKTRYDDASTPKYNKINANVVWVAGPEEAGHHWSSKTWVRYGSEFAAFIRKHRLGRVASPGPVLNVKHHEKQRTTCQVWVWTPNRDALIRWYERNPPTPEPPKPAPKPYVPPAGTAAAYYKVRGGGDWQRADGVVGWKCPHCPTVFARGELIFLCYADGQFYCEPRGIELAFEAEAPTVHVAPVAEYQDDESS